MSASLLAKIKRANARTEEPPSPALLPNPPKPRREIPAAQDWTVKRTRGRPRNEFAKHRLQQHPVDAFVETCLLPDPQCSEFLGSNTARPVQTVDGKFVRVSPQYQRLTLTQAYLAYCVENHFLAVVPKTFSGLLLKSCLERRWAVRETKAGDSRRRLISGVSIKGQVPFHGNDDRFMEGHVDRRRWIAKGKT